MSETEPQQRSPGAAHTTEEHRHSPQEVDHIDSPVDEDYPADGVRVRRPTTLLDGMHTHYSRQLPKRGMDELEEDERGSHSIADNSEELAEDYDEADVDESDDRDGGGDDDGGDPLMQVSDDDESFKRGESTSVDPPQVSDATRDEHAEKPEPSGHQSHSQQAPDAPPDKEAQDENRDDAAGPSPALPEAAAGEQRVRTVGLINEGCTCYLNSLLQLLFHLSYLRSAVYRIPAEEKDGANTPTVYKALQELFFQMQERTTPARTKRLTDSFGWGEQELFVQHDIQEMATLLRDNLEEKMKGTVTEGAINQLFEGRGEQFVETLDKSYTSRRKDVFYDIHIPLSDHTDLLDSLRSLTQRDQLVGDNKYKVEEEGKKPVYKDAERGYSFLKFPPVTWFHLKRFAMDLTSPMLEMKKVNSLMRFPLVLDLRDVERGLCPEELAEMEKGEGEDGEGVGVGGGGGHGKRGTALGAFVPNSPAIYDLQGVIVHRGTVRSGHYYCYIRDWDPVSRAFTRWVEFDDDSVRVVSESVAVDANYGGPLGRGFYGREPSMSNANAYILSYVRRADAPTILAPSPTDIITQRVKDVMRREMEEEERRAKLELAQRACLVMYVVTDESLAAYCECGQSELFPRDARTAKNYAACVVEVRKSDSLPTVYETVAAEPSVARRGVTPTNIRLWRWPNARVFRPTLPLATVEECSQQLALMSEYLTSSEMDKPISLCVYVQESISFLQCVDPSLPMPPLPPAADLLPLVKRSVYNSSQGTQSLRLKAPTRVQGLVLSLDVPCVHSCKVQFIATNAANEELPVHVYRGPVNDGTLYVPFDIDKPIASILLQCSSGADVFAIEDAHVEVRPEDLPPPLATATAMSKTAASKLPKMGSGRVLLFLKWFDHVSCTVRYVGSILVDTAATLSSLTPMWHLLMGLPVPPELVPPQHELLLQSGSANGKAPPTSGPPQPPPPPPPPQQQPPLTRFSFAFFEEGKGAVARELPPLVDLRRCGLHSGAVVVAQALDFPTAYRHAHVETYYRTLQSTVDLRVLEVATHRRDGEAEYRQCLAEHRKLAARLKERNAEKGHRQREGQETQMAESPDKPPPGPPPGPPPPPSSSSSLQSPTAPSAKAGEKVTEPRIEADPTLDPFNTSLPVLNQPQLAVVSSGVAKMPSHWLSETAYDAVALSTKTDPCYIRLYKNTHAAEPCPEERPVRDADGTVTVEDLVTIDAYTVSPVIFFERLSVPRAQLEQSFSLNVTLRDAAGFVLHCEAYTLQPRETWQGLVRHVCSSIRPWEHELDPWGSLPDTLAATHYILLAIGKRKKLIRVIGEVPMTAGGAEGGAHAAVPETRLDPALLDYDIELMPAAPLQPGEQRIACCHGDCRQADSVVHGHPFTITINQHTSVHDGLRLMQEITHVPTEVLNSQRETGKDYGVMMLTDVSLHFVDWEESLVRFWQYTQNRSGYIPSLMLNHARPREKPGSRYVAQHSPQLKIAKN